MRRQGEADAELRCPVIKAVVSPLPLRRPGPDLVRGGMEGTGRGWQSSGAKKPCVKRRGKKKKNPTAPWGMWG